MGKKIPPWVNDRKNRFQVRHYVGPPSPLGRLTQFGRQMSRGLQPGFRVLGSWALVLVVSGKGVYRDAGGVEATLKRGSAILVFPELGHHYGPPAGEGPWEEIYIVFEGPVFDLWRARGLLHSGHPVYHDLPLDMWLGYLEKFRVVPPGSPEGSVLYEMINVQRCLAELAAARGGPGPRSPLARAGGLISSDPMGAPRGGALAAACAMGYESFRKKFVSYFGVSPDTFRRQRLMEKACALLQDPGVTNREAAQILGLSDEYHFSKMFRQVMGETPKGFKQRQSLISGR